MTVQKSAFQSKRTGSADAGKNRTCWDLTLTIGIPFSRWGAVPFVLRPFPFSHDAQHAVQSNEKPKVVYASVHPFQLALRWQREILADAQVTKARIAKREGLSRARVTQIMNLLHLPILIQQQLQNPPHPFQIHSFSERRLRAILARTDQKSRMQDWQDWIRELRSSQPDC